MKLTQLKQWFFEWLIHCRGDGMRSFNIGKPKNQFKQAIFM
jgi:hypothetical protein